MKDANFQLGRTFFQLKLKRDELGFIHSFVFNHSIRASIGVLSNFQRPSWAIGFYEIEQAKMDGWMDG